VITLTDAPVWPTGVSVLVAVTTTGSIGGVVVGAGWAIVVGVGGVDVVGGVGCS